MSDPVAELAAKAVALDPEQRSQLIDLLLVSLGEAPAAAVEAAWDEEVERRLAAFDLGQVQAIDGETVLAEAHRLAR